MENENHLLFIIILLLVLAAFIIGDTNSRFSGTSGETIEASSASSSTVLGH